MDMVTMVHIFLFFMIIWVNFALLLRLYGSFTGQKKIKVNYLDGMLLGCTNMNIYIFIMWKQEMLVTGKKQLATLLFPGKCHETLVPIYIICHSVLFHFHDPLCMLATLMKGICNELFFFLMIDFLTISSVFILCCSVVVVQYANNKWG